MQNDNRGQFADFAEQGRQRRQQRRDQRQQQPHRKGRFFRWFVLAVNVAFLVWLATTLEPSGDCAGLTGDALTSCTTGEAVGSGLGMIVIVFLWALVDVILGVVYLVVRDRR